MEKIKILMVLGSTSMGGAQMFILNLLRNLNMKKFKVDFAVNFKEQGGGIETEIRQMGCEVYYLPYFKVYNYFQVIKEWRKFLTEHHYDIVHGHSTNSASVYLKVAKEMGCVTIAHCHSAGFRGNLFARLMKKIFIRDVGKVADYWFACSAKAAEHLYGKGYNNYPQYYDIPNAIDASQYLYSKETANKIREEIGVKGNEFLCGHVGSFSKPKNHIFLLAIFKEILDLNPKAKLVCCGAGGLLPEIKDKAAKMGISERIIFPGVVHNCNEYMMAMDVFVFPSLFEGFPFSVIEAQATGLPVVMSDVITTEVDITDNVLRCALNKSATEWAKKIVCLSEIKNRQTYNTAIANSKYNMSICAEMMEGLYVKMKQNSLEEQEKPVL